MKRFFEDKEVKNKEADLPWKKKHTDKMLDLYFAGVPPNRIAVAMQRNPKAVNRRIEQFRCNEMDRATRYEPVCRASRKGKRMTESEQLFISAHRKRKIPGAVTAKVLCRPPSELGLERAELEKVVDMRQIGTGVDLVLAYRYLYYCKHISILPDEAYDKIEKEELEFGSMGKRMLEKPGSDNELDYPPHIRALALYLAFKYTERENEDKKDKQQCEDEK